MTLELEETMFGEITSIMEVLGGVTDAHKEMVQSIEWHFNPFFFL